MQEYIIKNISITDDTYPVSLSNLSKPPKTIFIRGNDNLLTGNKPRLGVVGTRKPTSYGREATRKLVSAASEAGAIIISGLAFGIDSIAHQVALESAGSTIAVLPSDLENVYPASHTQLAQEILDSDGLLLSEYKPTNNAHPHKFNFIERNRLIAGLSDIILIPEATFKSGSRHTVNSMGDLGKPIAAVPGSIFSENSQFPNSLISENALVINTSADLLLALGLNNSVSSGSYKADNDGEQLIINALKRDVLSTNQLQQFTNLNLTEFNTHLTMLEIKHVIESMTDNKWRLI